jgi:hypothetical protein
MEISAKEKYLAYVGSQAGYDSYNRFKSFLYGEEDSLVGKLYQDVLKPMLQKHAGDTFSLCDIGGGDGRRLVSLLQKARVDFPRVRFEVDFVEPSPAGFGMAEGAIARVQGSATVRAQRATLEKAKLRPANYDLVLLIHSIFTFSSDESI